MEFNNWNQPRSADSGLARVAFLGLVFLLTWVGYEFPSDGPVNFWYAVNLMGVPAAYIVLLLLAALVAASVADSPSLNLPKRLDHLRLWNWTIAAAIVIFLALSRGLWDGVADLFADWRNIGVTGLVAVIAARFLSTRSWRNESILDVAILYGFASWIPLFQFALGGGSTLLGVRIPIYYGPALYLAGFAALVAFDFWTSGILHGIRKLFVFIAGTGGIGLVVLSFRRTYWLLVAIGLVAILHRQMRDRSVSKARIYAAIGGLLVVITAAFVLLGAENLVGRLASFVPGSSSRYSATNSDHINDMVEAWSVAQKSWIEGLGIGKFYETPSLVGWKSNSFEVHNAMIHVWLKFGLAGVIAYLGFHYRWFKACIANSVADPIARRGLAAAGTFLIAEFVSALFSTWPYGSFQQSVQHGLLLGALVVLNPSPQPVPILSQGPREAPSLAAQ